MNDTADQKSAGVAPRAKQLASAASEKLHEANEAARSQVQKYPLATVGIAFGVGLALGAVGWALLAPRPPTLRDRFDDLGERFEELTDKKNFRKLLARFR
ncbi:MAG: hypothetical protein IPJ65_21340 [Archangiaceae bacterium]|nr:hypothetical protein [Archangiaceae bacterium]